MYNIYFGVIDIIYTNENLIITCFSEDIILVNYILDFKEKKRFQNVKPLNEYFLYFHNFYICSKYYLLTLKPYS